MNEASKSIKIILGYFRMHMLFKFPRTTEINNSSDAYSEPCQTSKMECFTKIGNGF